VSIDKTAPVTSVSGIPAGWSKNNVTVTLTPSADGLSPITSTQYSTDGGGTWTSGTSATIATEGTTALQYRSTDGAGNVEATKTTTVGIDSVRPAPKALANKSVKKGKTVKLPYRVDDSSCPQAKVTIRIYKGTKLRKTLTVGLKATGVNLTRSYTCTLPKGKCSWKVYARDLAGNTQVKPGVRTLTVK
jgi:hypothetical protein